MMWKRFWWVVSAGLIGATSPCWSADAPAKAGPAKEAEAKPIPARTRMYPTPTQPVWDASDGSYSRFWISSGTFHVLVDDLTGDGRQDLIFTTHSTGMIQVFRQVERRRFVAVGEQDIAGFHPNDTIALPGAPKRYVINGEGDARLRVVSPQPDGRLNLVGDAGDHDGATTGGSWQLGTSNPAAAAGLWLDGLRAASALAWAARDAGLDVDCSDVIDQLQESRPRSE